MKQEDKTRKLLLNHYKQYPALQIQDVFKFIHQSAFGCEHMVSSLKVATEYICKENEGITANTDNLIDTLDGDYSRVHLSYLKLGLSAETLGKLFYKSAQKEENGISNIENKVTVASELITEGALPFSIKEFNKEWNCWEENGYPALHHSKHFRDAYSPAYRVIANRYVEFLPIFLKIDMQLKNGSAVVAIEGGSASGKTALSQILSEIYDCTVFHMDDFFLQPEQRTPERFAEIGGNVDRERFLKEVLIPLSKNEPINYSKFDCSAFKLMPPVKVTPKKLIIIEGAYSMHPDLAEYYNFSVFLDISPELQKKRILKRNSPEFAKRFFKEWIPLEQIYFSKMKVKERCAFLKQIL